MPAETMLKNNALSFLYSPTDKENEVRMGLVISRAGLGKTSILVQIALENMIRGRRVLHVSIGSGLDKVRTWYDDILHGLAANVPAHEYEQYKDELLRRRMIMTFQEAAFSRPKFEERLNDLVYQNIFRPECVVVDGFDFATADWASLGDLKDLAETMSLQVWFSAISHRDDTRASAAGVPAPCHLVDDLFDTVIVLRPEGKVLLDVVKDKGVVGGVPHRLTLDPVTFLVQDV